MSDSMFQRKEQGIREFRTIEAMKKGLMGAEGKLCRIARTFGDPIWKQGSGSFEQDFLADPYDMADPDDIPTMDEDEVSHQIGWHFDGMRRGMHLEIMWQEEFREIKVYLRGYLVYREVGGELDGYVPNAEWEDKIEALFVETRKAERENKKILVKEVTAEAARQQKRFLDDMRLKWGI